MGGFHRSGRNIKLAGPVLPALCQRPDGFEGGSSTDLNSCLDNNNGNLVASRGGNLSTSSDNFKLTETVFYCYASYGNENGQVTSIDLSFLI